jgi:hypothetical protein
MAECRLQRVTGTDEYRGQGSVVHEYLFLGDAVTDNPLSAIAIARTAGPHPLPPRGAVLAGTNFIAREAVAVQTGERRDSFAITVNFSPPDPGEDEGSQSIENPLERPTVYDIQYIEQEYVVDKARNVEALSHGDGKGANRAANTLGPIVNAAGKRPDEPIVDTERNAIIVIERNYATLGAIMALNETYQRTTNSDAITIGGESVDARRLKYLVTRSNGRQVENEIEYYRGTTEIELKKTTDRILDNVGYDYWDGAQVSRYTDPTGEFPAEPINLKLDGTEDGDNTTTITYRYLEPVAYASFFA